MKSRHLRPLIYITDGRTLDVNDRKFDITVRFCDAKNSIDDGAWPSGEYLAPQQLEANLKKLRPAGARIIFEEQAELEYFAAVLSPYVRFLDVVAKHSRAFDLSPIEQFSQLETVQLCWNIKQTSLWDVTKNQKLKILSMTDYYRVADYSCLRGSTIEDLRLYGCNGMSSFVSKLRINDLGFLLEMPMLKSLSLDIVKDESDEYYLEFFSKCKNLTHLDITGSFFSFEQYARLKSRLPNVKTGLDGVVDCDGVYWIIGKGKPKNLSDPEKAEAYRLAYAELVEKYKA